MDIQFSCPADDPVLSIGRECLGFNVRRTARELAKAFDEALASSGLKNTQFAILAGLHATGPVTIQAFAKVQNLDRTTLTRNLRPLEREGLIELQPGDDRRTRTVSLTDAGETRLQGAIPLWRSRQERLVAALGEGQAEQLRTSLALLARAANG